MADKEKEESKDGKGNGGCCGCFMGCLVVIAVATAFVLGFWVVPELRDNNWSWDVFPRRINEFRERLGFKIDDWNNRFIKLQDKTGEIGDEIEETVDQVKKTTSGAVEKVEPLIENDLQPTLIED